MIFDSLKNVLRRKSMESLGFKWSVGDVVSPKFTIAVAGEVERGWFRQPAAFKLHVVERLYQECPGGVQRHYTCRPIDAGTGTPHTKTLQFNEIELKDVEPETAK